MSGRPVETLPRLSVTVGEAAEMTGVSKDVLYAHIKNGDLPAARPSRALVIRLEDLDAWLEEMKSRRPNTDA